MYRCKKILPIGIQTFRDIREEGCYYVDKTEFIRRLVDEGSHYFVKFTFLTGVSKFSTAGRFSGLKSLSAITPHARYSSV